MTDLISNTRKPELLLVHCVMHMNVEVSELDASPDNSIEGRSLPNENLFSRFNVNFDPWVCR